MSKINGNGWNKAVAETTVPVMVDSEIYDDLAKPMQLIATALEAAEMLAPDDAGDLRTVIQSGRTAMRVLAERFTASIGNPYVTGLGANIDRMNGGA